MSYFSDASLVFIPSAQKSGKAYSIKPTDGTGDLTFTRSNDTATRVASNGLIEKVRTNVLLQSNSFDTTWVNTNSTDTGGQADKDGGTTAWLLESTTASGEAYLRQTISASGLSTFSIYAKAGTADFLGVYINATTGIDPYVYFNLSTGAVGTTATTATPSIVSVGSGWYRCSVAYNATIANIDVYVTTADGSFLSTTGDNIVIQASQLESGDIATEPILTTSAAVSVGPVANVPRLDYLGSSCPRLLLEPQRTNSMVNSETFASWTGFNNITIGSNTSDTLDPAGYNGSDKITIGSGAPLRVYQFTGSTAGTGTISLFAKAGTASTISLFTSSASLSVSFNLATQVVTPNTGTGTITSYGNGWYRITATATLGSNEVLQILFTGSNGQTIYVWGAQVEAGAYATSYIPTLGAAVTRGADACSDGGDIDTFNDNEGVLYVEISALANDSTNRIISVSDGSGSNRLLIKYDNSSNLIETSLTSSGVDQAVLTHTYTIVNNAKIAFKYKANDFALWVNGTEVDTDSSGVTPSGLDTFNFDNGSGGSAFFGNAKQVLYFPTALTNAQLAELTA